MAESPHSSKSRGKAIRHADGVLVCPRCEIPLRGSDHELGIAWRCGRCQGQSLNYSQFRRLVPEAGANDIWLEVATHPLRPRERTRCPECLADMDAVVIPLHGRSVELDICRPCQRLWLDRQEQGESATPGLVRVSAALPVERRRGWFGARAPAGESVSSAQREALFSALERNADGVERKLEHRLTVRFTLYGMVAAGVCYLLCWWVPSVIRFRIATAAGLAVFALRLLRRK